MDLRQLFIAQTWWGKLLGAICGYLIAGPAGALFGVVIGNFFDRGLTQHFASSFWYYRAERNPDVRRIFCMHLYAVLGHVAKADGRVTAASIQFAKQCMQEMHLNTKEKKLAQDYFTAGKASNYNLAFALTQVYSAIYQHPKLIKLFIDSQYQMSQIEPSLAKLRLMNAILRAFNLTPLPIDEPSHTRYQRYTHQSSSRQSHAPQANTTAFAVLNVQPTATHAEVKRAYRRLMSRHHPDKLIAKGMPESAIQAANAKTQTIRKAYEEICLSKGWT